MWRYIDGQALLEVYMIAIFVDKVWVGVLLEQVEHICAVF